MKRLLHAGSSAWPQYAARSVSFAVPRVQSERASAGGPVIEGAALTAQRAGASI
ncbi:MAG: hypothetical protein ICV60_18015 [Pyrinomonadaceae bacterium]|nr:hypothetical protein [Pyrinomonadaceae bacterium]